MTDQVEIPDKLYKYRTFDNDCHYEELFKNNKIFFSSPRHFNDPFDCRVFPDYNSGTPDQIFTKMLEHATRDNPRLNSKEIKEIAKSEFRKNIKIIRTPELMAKRMNEIVDTTLGVCSFTEKNNNLLMWAHYADSHDGFCVEFDAKILSQIFINHIKIEELIFLKKMKYRNEYPLVNPYLITYTVKEFIKLVTTKSKDWEYEQEWRAVYSEHPDEGIELPDEIITGIYFGTNCSEQRINDSIKFFENKKFIPIFYKAKLKQKTFGLVFDKIK